MTTYLKKEFFFLLFFILFLPISQSFTFTETFGTSNFSYFDDCSIVNEDNFTADNYENIGTDISQTFNNTFTCLTDQDSNVRLENRSAELVNTEMGLRIFNGNCVSPNCHIGIGNVFPNDLFSLTENDDINFSCSNFPAPSGTNPVAAIVLGDDEGKQSALLLNEMGAGSGCGLSGSGYSPVCCRIWSLYNNACINTTNQNISLGLDTIMDYCAVNDVRLNTSNFEELSYIALEYTNAGNSGYIIDDLTFSYVNGSNALPLTNFSITEPYSCINDVFNQSVIFNLTIDTFDTDSDEIYYRLASSTQKFVTDHILFSKQNCFSSFCYWEKDSSFFTSDNYINFSGDCLLKPNLFEVPAGMAIENSYTTDRYGLMLHDTNQCNPNLAYKYDQQITTGKLALYFEELDQNNEGFNLTFWDNTKTKPVARIKVEVIDEFLIVSSFNTTFTQLSNTSTAENYLLTIHSLNTNGITQNPFNIVALDSPEAAIGTLLVEDNLTIINSNENIALFEITTQDSTSFIINEFHTSSGDVSINFTTTKPTTLEVFSTGYIPISLYISDSAHQPNVYSLYQDIAFVKNGCEGLRPNALGKGNIQQDPITFVDTYLGTGLRNLMLLTGFYELGKTVLWWMWLFFFISFLGTQIAVFNKINLIIPLFLSSVMIAILSFLLDYKTHFLSSLIMIALSLFVPIMAIINPFAQQVGEVTPSDDSFRNPFKSRLQRGRGDKTVFSRPSNPTRIVPKKSR